MKIGELAERTGVSVRSLRYYEEQGLLQSERSPGGHRFYAEADIERVRYLQRLYTAGLTSQDILAVMPCLLSPSDATNEAAFTHMLEQRDKLKAHIAGLTQTLESLEELIALNRQSRAAMPE